MMQFVKPCLLVLAMLGCTANAAEAVKFEASRGELLYSTSCIECHKEQVHWRGNKKVKDWDTLNVEVKRWKDYLGLDWNQYDAEMVARYLNAMHYHYPLQDR